MESSTLYLTGERSLSAGAGSPAELLPQRAEPPRNRLPNLRRRVLLDAVLAGDGYLGLVGPGAACPRWAPVMMVPGSVPTIAATSPQPPAVAGRCPRSSRPARARLAPAGLAS